MTISLPDSMKQYVDEQVRAGDYSDAGEFVRELVRADQKRRAKKQLEEILLGALQSGDAMDMTAAQVEEVRERIRARARG